MAKITKKLEEEIVKDVFTGLVVKSDQSIDEENVQHAAISSLICLVEFRKVLEYVESLPEDYTVPDVGGVDYDAIP